MRWHVILKSFGRRKKIADSLGMTESLLKKECKEKSWADILELMVTAAKPM